MNKSYTDFFAFGKFFINVKAENCALTKKGKFAEGGKKR
jgi:hypothetical protein